MNEIFHKRPWLVYTILLLLSFGIYLYYFNLQILHPNSFLSSITGDSIKNYYTFVYHVKHDSDFLHFGGMNYPFGEHVVYTDCQPLLTWILRLFPFMYDHLIGILHILIFGSFIITPLIMFRLFQKLGVAGFPSFFSSLAVSVLSPLILKIYWGHFALAYPWVIPLLFLMFISSVQKPGLKKFGCLLIYNFLLFFIHPYTALSCCIFTCLAGTIYFVFDSGNTKRLRMWFFMLVSGLFPVILFRIFMFLTDSHAGRSVEPMNLGTLESNLGCLLVPAFGPLASVLQLIFRTSPANYEGFTYLGVIMIVMTVVLLPFIFLKIKLLSKLKFSVVILISSIILLFISFGWLADLLAFFHLESSDLKQFRAIARLNNFIYFALPCFAVPFFCELVKGRSFQNYVIAGFSVVYFSVNLFEAHFMFKMGDNGMWRSSNFFSKTYLKNEQRETLRILEGLGAQAITTVPLFLYGSEVIDRDNWNNSMIPAMLYSSQSGVPIIGSNMSRTSLTETKSVLDIFNEYKKNRPVIKTLGARPIVVFVTKNPMLPIEDRLKDKVMILHRNDTIAMGTVALQDLVWKKSNHYRVFAKGISDSSDHSFLYIPYENRKPFLDSKMEDYEKIQTIEAGRLQPGKYVVSFHYYYQKEDHRGLACNLIITRKKGEAYEWFFNDGVKRISAMYDGFGVYEVYVDIEEEAQYEFLLKGTQNETYRISDFMIRKKEAEIVITGVRDTMINNFPLNAP